MKKLILLSIIAMAFFANANAQFNYQEIVLNGSSEMFVPSGFQTYLYNTTTQKNYLKTSNGTLDFDATTFTNNGWYFGSNYVLFDRILKTESGDTLKVISDYHGNSFTEVQWQSISNFTP